MISFDEACAIIGEHTHLLGIMRRRLENLNGSVLAEPIQAGFDLPRFNNSAVDGYGVLLADIAEASKETPVALTLAGIVQAGDSGKIKIQRGQTIQILTGAPVPAGVEAVVMQEFTRSENGANSSMIQFFKSAEADDNIRFKGEEFHRGQSVIAAGTVITPPVIGLLATLGLASAKVYRKPKVGLISTGNELIRPGQKLGVGQIYDSNSYALSAALQSIGVESVKTYHVKDDPRATRRIFEKALKENDVLISLGGVSVGQFDFVKDVVEALNIETRFWRIAIKPGKPVYFGTQGKKLIFGLPGNPVSALVTYHQLVQPALLRMMGYPQSEPLRWPAQLGQALRKKPGRQEFVRGQLYYQDQVLSVQPTTGQDSHMLGGLAAADCLIDFPTADERLRENESVQVDVLSWQLGLLSSVPGKP